MSLQQSQRERRWVLLLRRPSEWPLGVYAGLVGYPRGWTLEDWSLMHTGKYRGADSVGRIDDKSGAVLGVAVPL